VLEDKQSMAYSSEKEHFTLFQLKNVARHPKKEMSWLRDFNF